MKPENKMLTMVILGLPFILICLLLAGCATTQPLQVTAPCPKPNIPGEPHYPVSDLKRGDDAATVAKAYVVTNYLKDLHIAELKNILGAYE
jgi:hypothetical protein